MSIVAGAATHNRLRRNRLSNNHGCFTRLLWLRCVWCSVLSFFILRTRNQVTSPMTQASSGAPQLSRPPHKLEREESQLWRWILLFMVLLALGFAYLAWERLESLPYHLGPMALGVLVLSVLLAVYAYGRRKEVSELKVLLQDLQEHVGAGPSEKQLDQLSDVIARSNRSFKELIDSFEDSALAVSLDGTLRPLHKSRS